MDVAARLEAEEAQGPVGLYWINTASQTLPTSGVMDTAGTAEGDLEFDEGLREAAQPEGKKETPEKEAGESDPAF